MRYQGEGGMCVVCVCGVIMAERCRRCSYII